MIDRLLRHGRARSGRGRAMVSLVLVLAVPGCGTPVAAVPTAELLDSLVVIGRPKPDGSYRRAAFGASWSDTDGNGCNQRDDALQRYVDQALPHRFGVQGACDHDALSGTW
ncbi:MAG: hypothetical protein ABWY56_16220, partial [Propionibacteriaceae bacterium]